MVVTARWPHPSPWWGQVFWPKVILGLPVLWLFLAVKECGWETWREDRRDDQTKGHHG